MMLDSIKIAAEISGFMIGVSLRDVFIQWRNSHG